MDPLSYQTELLEKFAQIVHDEAGQEYEKIVCDFEYNANEGWSESEYRFWKNGIEVRKGISVENSCRSADLLADLHAAMKAHTGGDWKSFTLTLGSDGRAQTKFHYPESGGL